MGTLPMVIQRPPHDIQPNFTWNNLILLKILLFRELNVVINLRIAQVTKAYNYIHKYGHKSKLMAAAVRNKQDVFSLLGYFTMTTSFVAVVFCLGISCMIIVYLIQVESEVENVIILLGCELSLFQWFI